MEAPLHRSMQLSNPRHGQNGEIETKSALEWDAELQQRREDLDMNTNTNAGVIDLYNRRKAEVSACTFDARGTVTDPRRADRRTHCYHRGPPNTYTQDRAEHHGGSGT